MNKYDTSQLTEFPRFEPESTQSGVSTFFNKLWKFPIFSPNDNTEGESKASEDNKQPTSQPEQHGKEEEDDLKTETGTYAVEFEGRSLPNVLKRISSLVALGSGGGTRYADTELARYWMPDDISRECYECAARFSALRRRHHCRVCGQIFCSRCCSQRVPGQIFGCAGGLRVCTYCCNVVLSYLRENDPSGDISPDLRTLQETLQVKFPDNKSSLSAAASREFLFLHEAEEREARGSPREPPHDLFRRLALSLPTQQHRYRLVRYNGVWRGCDIMQWIMDNTNNKTRAQATLVCEALICAGYMECATEMGQFADYALYRPLVIPTSSTREEDERESSFPAEECNRLVESVSTYCLDLNLGDSSARLTKAPKTETKSSPSSDEDNPILEHSNGYPEAHSVCRAIEQSGEEHLRLLLRQSLARAALPAAWLDTLYPLCVSAADTIAPDIQSNNMDIRNYVQIKKVPGGEPRDSCLVPGVVLTKNVAHRGMPQQITNPTVLLLDCSITYQRVEGKLTSLEPVLMQEQEYLVRCAARIAALRPRVVLVRGSVARGVQDALRAQGVALAAGVRERALRRAARCAHADLVTSIDARIGMPRLGTCNNFYVRNYSGKTLMVLEGCAEPHLGCCILLRGASIQELIRVKKVVKFMLLACYNWKLEKAFLGDIEAVLPEPGMTFADDDDIDKDTVANDTADTSSDIKNDNDEANDIFGDSADAINNDNVNYEDTKSNDSVKINDDLNTIDVGMASNDTEITDKLSTNDFVKSDETSIKSHKKNYDIGKSSETANDSCLTKVEEIDDPLQKARFSRKTDSDKNLSCGVPIRDFSDPLRATFSEDDDVFLPKEETELKADDTHSDRWSTDDVVLSMSPNIVIPSPWAHSGRGGSSVPPLLRAAPAPTTPRAPRRRSTPRVSRPLCKAAAPFVDQAIAQSAEEAQLRASLALFRASGCRLLTGPHKRDCPLYSPSVVKKVSKESEVDSNEKQIEANEPLDPFAPENHQRISLLLYSYSSKSANVPDFCVNPWIVTMEMYGRNDISLGAFLHKYCFSGEQRCPSSACLVPMNQHVRKFVHDDVCITITCNTIGHSNADKQPSDERGKQVRFWSRCERCGVIGRGAGVSRAALALSLAQYLRMRCAATRYAPSAPCPHPLHRHAHAFVCGLTTACFRYSKISTYEMELPPEQIAINYEPKQMRDALIAQLNELMLKGHETFSSVADSEAEKEYQAFKQHMDRIHLALTSASLQTETSLAGVVRALWAVSDRLVSAERMLRDARERWPPHLADRKHHDLHVEEKSDVEESPGDCGNSDNAGTTYVFNSDNNSKDTDKEHTGTEEDEERGDKKTVRQILSQLLSNNQSTNQGSIIISTGVVPVVVRAGDVGSVIAATLASATYQRSLRLATLSTQSEQDENENSASKEKSEADKQKAAKALNEHIEVMLKEGLSCRVYYATAFRRLRHMLLAGLERRPPCLCACDSHDKDVKPLCEIEECFLRSLAHSEPWATRGGKSGSTFCKTVDDRYVLKEMTKPEWQQFLEFAPHYFNYVTSCHQNKQPSLLARIVGVYSVGGSGSGVLVAEHVWHACPPHAPRFDLKGTARPAPPGARGALADAELLRLRWEHALHVRGGEWRAVWACAERDTQFLAQHAVMDYSLLLAVDSDARDAQRGGRLVLGIIDYIRTFTWDKKLEHLVKKNLGSGQPTVVSPEQYRRRLLAACRNYFLQCPSHWDHLIGTKI